MNAFQKCKNTNDAVPLYLPQQLYLKPIARLTLTVQLTQKMMGKTITHHEVMERLRELIRPDEFTLLKVTKTTLEVIRFEAEVEIKSLVARVVAKLDNKTIKLKDFAELMRVRAAEAKLDFPTRHDWDSFFRDAKDMNEMKPGERPDTVHISNVPTRWFVPSGVENSEALLPSEKIFARTFEKYGAVRTVDVPICDPYRSKMKSHIAGVQTSSFDDTEFFEGYVQFKDYIGFSKCMDALRGKKLLRRTRDEDVTVNIYVAYDKTKHLSEATLRRRQIVRDRMILKQKDKEDKQREAEEEKHRNEMADKQKELDKKAEKERRRREREERRKAKILQELKVKGSDDITAKIAREERKLLKVQRRLEAIRLVEELFKRIKTKLDKKETQPVETPVKNDKLSKMKAATEGEVELRRRKLHSAIEGRVILKSIIGGRSKDGDGGDSSTESSLISENSEEERVPMDVPWYGYLQSAMPVYNGMNPYCQPARGFPYYFPRGRGLPGPSGRPMYPKRHYGGQRGRGRRPMNHLLNQEYYKYAQNVLYGQYRRYDGRPRSYSRSRSRSRSYSRHRSRSRSRTRSRTPSHHRSRSHSRDRSRYRTKTRSRSKSRTKSVRSRRSSTPKKSRRRSRSTTTPRRRRSTDRKGSR